MNWQEIARWNEWRAKKMREDAEKAERFTSGEEVRAFAASVRRAADLLEEDALRWRQRT